MEDVSLPNQDLEVRGSPPEDMRVLRALWNIFNAFSVPREELLEAAEQQGTHAGVSPSSSSPQLGNGVHACHTVLPCLWCTQKALHLDNVLCRTERVQSTRGG